MLAAYQWGNTRMTIALWCVLAAAGVPYLFTLLAKSSPAFNNRRPRDYLESTSGWRKRAHWAQLNGFEAFPPFAAAVLVAHVVAGANASADQLALAFVGLRIAFGFCYVADLAWLRSLLWFGGVACVVGLFVIASRAS